MLNGNMVNACKVKVDLKLVNATLKGAVDQCQSERKFQLL